MASKSAIAVMVMIAGNSGIVGDADGVADVDGAVVSSAVGDAMEV